MRLPLALAVSGILLLGFSPAFAQATDACAGFKWPVVREQKALSAPDLPKIIAGGSLPIGGAAAATLSPEASVSYTVKPARPPKNNPAYGGEFALPDAAQAETIQVALSADAWVDVVQNGKVLRSTGFSGKTGCPDIRKSVRFAIAPGPARIAISNAPDPAIRVAVVPAP